MNWLGKVFGSGGVGDKSVAEAQRIAVEKARQQSYQLKIIKESEAMSIGEACGVTDKLNQPSEFIDIALVVLTYPPEFANFLAGAFKQFTPALGFDPYHPIQRAVAHADSLCAAVIVDGTFFTARPELLELISDRNKRIDKAASYLAVMLALTSSTAAQAQRVFISMSQQSDSSISDALRVKATSIGLIS